MTPDHATNAKRLSLGLLATVAVLLGGASTAWAGAGVSVVPAVPSNVAVGTTAASSISITNNSFNGAGETNFDTDGFQVSDITLVPSCGSQVFSADCPAGARDPGVLVPSNTATGQAGTACAGRTFTRVLIDAAQAKYRFTPDATVVLGPSSGPLSASRCVIDFTTNVAQVPAIDSNVGSPGLQTDQKGFTALEDITVGSPNFGLTANGLGTTQTTVVPERALSISPTGTGSGFVDSSPVGIDCGANAAAHTDCGQDYTDGTSVTLTAHPSVNTDFAGFTGDCVDSALTCTMTMNQARSVTAIFTLMRTLSVDAPHGTGVGYVDSSPAGIDCGNVAGHGDCAERVPDGTQITLTAHPDANSGFGGFTGGGCSTSPCTVTMDANKVVFPAMFLKPFPLDLTTAGSGSGYVDSSPAGIDCGRNLDGHADCAESYDPYVPEAVTLTAHPADDSDFAGFTGACTDSGPTCTTTMDTAKSGTATFTLKPGPDPPAATTPTTEITRMPSNPRPRLTRFGFTSSEPESTFTCRLDKSAPEPCVSPFVYRHLKRGRHTFSVFATDGSGNADPTPVTTGFRVRHARND
jgi:Divergent InlB B-repeat domain